LLANPKSKIQNGIDVLRPVRLAFAVSLSKFARPVPGGDARHRP
jgi:hypothetical protein